jgi:hypothetical protein
MRVTHNADADNRSECGYPANHRNELQKSAQDAQCDGVRKPQQKQGRGIEQKGKTAEKYLCPNIAGEHYVQLARYSTNSRTAVRRKEQLDQDVCDVIAVAQEKDCQDRNQKQHTKQLRGIGKIPIYGRYQALDALSVPRVSAVAGPCQPMDIDTGTETGTDGAGDGMADGEEG